MKTEMSTINRVSLTRKILSGILLLAGFLFAVGSGNLPARAQVKAAGTPGLVVSISADKASFGTADQVTLHVTFTNPTGTSIGLLKWFTPAEGVTGPLFTVTSAVKPATYVGILVKHATPTAQDYIMLAPGKSLSSDVNLADYYNLSVSGNYSVTFAAGGLTSNTLTLFVEGRPARVPQAIPARMVSGTNNFNNNCSTSQRADLINARQAANNYAIIANAYFIAQQKGPRYTTWFGVFDSFDSSSRYSLVSSHFTAISSAVDAKQISFDCLGPLCQSNSYSYVYPGSPYNIYLCSSFWSISTPLIGTDSKAGTLIHEISHFNVVAGTIDYTYGQSSSKRLATSNPAQAIANADSHEYFAENNPPLELPTSFSDVPSTYWAWSAIMRVYSAGYTTGCSVNPLSYCPEKSVTRAEMAVFIERGMRGATYIPPAATGTVFADVPLSYWGANWIEKIYADKITSGCGTSPLKYCPENPITRAEMAVFLLKAKHGSNYNPPAAVGIFTDVRTSYWAASWIEQLLVEGITGGCSLSPISYCPEKSVTRAEMAVFLVRTFNLL